MEFVNLSKYEGVKIPIKSVEVIEAKSNWDKDGQFITGLNRTVLLLRITTESIGQNNIKGVELFNTVQDPQSSKWGYSIKPNSKIQKLLKRQNVKKPEELVGTLVTLRVRNHNMPDGKEVDTLGFIY